MIDVQSLKRERFSEALTCYIPIIDHSGNELAKLIPIGSWALSDEQLLASFASWRKKFMRLFLSQFDASVESTRNYIKNFSIGQSDRIFFGIYVDDNLIGHIGLSNIISSHAELDNIIRGKVGGHNDLMYFAEKSLLTWAFEEISVDRISAQVMSKNIMALSLHERFGFELKKRFHLKKVTAQDSIIFERCGESESTEKFYLDIIELHKSTFLDQT